jgi:DoxX-like family
MTRKVIYWGSTGLIALMSLFAAFSYLSGAQEAVAGFARVGYPQQLRVILGLAKLAGAIVLVVPGFPRLKEWAYAGFTFAWICAIVAHYLAGQRSEAFVPVALLVLLGVSYFTRPEARRWPATATLA